MRRHGDSDPITQTAGAHPNVQGWHATPLKHIVLPRAAVRSPTITFGELACGLGLIMGMFTGIVAFSGAFMNTNHMLAGAVGINPILLFLELLLPLAWRVRWFHRRRPCPAPLTGDLVAPEAAAGNGERPGQPPAC
jgi:thiosulfate dehydrogenase [quinone] large subunit